MKLDENGQNIYVLAVREHKHMLHPRMSYIVAYTLLVLARCVALVHVIGRVGLIYIANIFDVTSNDTCAVILISCPSRIQ